MAKTRAMRRAAREAERSARIAAARERNQSRQRRAARRARWMHRLRVTAAPGLVARTRRRRIRLLVFGLILLNTITWLITPDAAARGFVAVVSLLLVPMLTVFLVGRAR